MVGIQPMRDWSSSNGENSNELFSEVLLTETSSSGIGGFIETLQISSCSLSDANAESLEMDVVSMDMGELLIFNTVSLKSRNMSSSRKIPASLRSMLFKP